MAAAKSVISEWPPALSKDQLDELTSQATTYALANGLLYLPAAEHQPPAPTSAIHAPVSLLPSPLPRQLFLRAKRLQRIYNVLYARIAMDVEFLDDVMGTDHGVGKVDDFIGQLWTGWKDLRDEGLVQELQLGLFRSDYLVHVPDEITPVTLKQVEFNTISVSFGCLSERVSRLHRFLYQSTRYYNISPHLHPDNFPSNNTTAGLVEGLAAAHKAYDVEGSLILFVVQPDERNVFDQKPLEYALLENYSIHVIRRTFDELAQSASLDPSTRSLRVSCSQEINPAGSVEISTVYYRCGYVPNEYPTPTHYATRFVLERSRAIKCPSIALQMAGGKKVQQVLAQPGVLERFLCDEKKYGKDIFSKQDVDELRDSWMDMWGLDVGEDWLNPDQDALSSGNESFGVKEARRRAAHVVLKPQREGGGNNVYKEAIPSFLDGLPPTERQAWIAMELIRTPEGAGNYLLRAGGATDGISKAEVVSELGIFGWALFGASQDVSEDVAGWLVRTKSKESNEGGVATGYSVLDSVLLVD